MKKHTYRSLLIWASIIISLLVIYPTVRWMMTPDAAKDEKLARWAEIDDQRATEEHGYFDNVFFKVKRWAEGDRNQVINLGLDLQGGIQMVVSFDWRELPQQRIDEYRKDPNTDSDEEIESLVQDTIYSQLVNRINEFEAKEPIIQKLGNNQIQVQLPGEKDTNRAIAIIKKTAKLDFNIVAGRDETVQVFTKIKERFPNEFSSFLERPAPGEPVWVKAENFTRVQAMVEKLRQLPGVIPDDKMLAFSKPPRPGEPQRYDLYVLDKKPIANGDGLTSASTSPDPQNPANWAINFTFDSEGAAIFGKATEENINRAMAIVLDGQVMSAPNINSRIDFHGQITGRFDADEARDLAITLNSGSMMVPVHEDSTDVVSASLGADSVKSGVTSGLWGLAVVGIFVLVYYMVPGGIALIALALNSIYVIAAMAYFDMTLTLPGIAGLILTIGMAVDANVLIFERMREELRLGHSTLSAIDTGFSKAAVTILDANITTLIAALVLFQFGTGPIEGFAITLSIGVCCSVFTALVVGRALFDFFYESRRFKSVKMLNAINPDSDIPFMKMRKICGTLSAAVIVVSLVLFGWKLDKGEMLGVDFTQGTNARVNLHADQPVELNEVRTALNNAGFAGPTVQQIGEGELATNEFLIRVGDIDAADIDTTDDPTIAQRIGKALGTTVGGDESKVEFESVKTVGPAVGAQLQKDAVWAIIWTLLFISIYIGYRFHMNYAMGALVALIHDVCITLGVFALLDRQINLAVIAAILTVMGYSLNDTIVVFDRIREDVERFKGKGKTLSRIMDIAVNSTLSRTLLTSLTTLFVVIMLFIFGGADIQDFALALIVGIVVGTYSSIFVASPVVLVWDTYFNRGPGGSDGGAKDETAGRRYISPKKKKKKSKKTESEGEATA